MHITVRKKRLYARYINMLDGFKLYTLLYKTQTHVNTKDEHRYMYDIKFIVRVYALLISLIYTLLNLMFFCFCFQILFT